MRSKSRNHGLPNLNTHKQLKSVVACSSKAGKQKKMEVAVNDAPNFFSEAIDVLQNMMILKITMLENSALAIHPQEVLSKNYMLPENHAVPPLGQQ